MNCIQFEKSTRKVLYQLDTNNKFVLDIFGMQYKMLVGSIYFDEFLCMCTMHKHSLKMCESTAHTHTHTMLSQTNKCLHPLYHVYMAIATTIPSYVLLN